MQTQEEHIQQLKFRRLFTWEDRADLREFQEWWHEGRSGLATVFNPDEQVPEMIA